MADPKCKVPTDPEAKKWFDEVQRQARQIDHLLQLHELKERTIEKLSKRLEHSLQMLKAVQEMYEQQQKVIAAQQKVIEEFKSEEDDEDEAEAESEPAVVMAPRQVAQTRPMTPSQMGGSQFVPPRSPAQQVDRGVSPKSQAAAVEQRVQQLLRQTEVNEDDEDDLDGEESPEQQIQKMLSLVSEVEKMRKMLTEAKAEQESLEGGVAQHSAQAAAVAQVDDDDDDLEEDGLTAEQQQGELSKLLQNLKMVEDEKKRTQRELMAAQQEQESMVRKLAEMKAMMSALDKEVKRK